MVVGSKSKRWFNKGFVKLTLHPLGFYCPILSHCCYCIPLKLATFVIAILGIVPTAVCILLTTSVGTDFLEDHGIPAGEAAVISYLYAVLGIIMFSAHVILFVAAITRLMKLFAVHLWIMIFYIILSLALAFWVWIDAQYDDPVFGIIYILLAMLFTALLIYFWIVVQSELYTVKDESNVINIHITII